MSIAANLHSVRKRIENAAIASGRQPHTVKLVAVSKTFPLMHLQEAVSAEQRLFGENYIPEGSEKALALKALHPDVRFHFIGRLQRNKVRTAVKAFDLIETVDRKELAVTIDKEAGAIGKQMSILIQVNISEQDSKGGCALDELVPLAQFVSKLENLQLQGIMSIGSALGLDIGVPVNRERVEREFQKMVALKKQAEETLRRQLPELSMGMSNDFELAIAHGATIVRIGSSIFGSR